MKFYSITDEPAQQEILKKEYEDARAIGSVSVGTGHLFYKKIRKVYFLSYSEITRCFRRVMMVPMKMCCGSGDMPVERLIVCTEKGEVLEAPMPDSRSAKAVMEEIAKNAPEVELGTPKKEDAQNTPDK